MSEHLSALVLDELAAGLAPPPEHLSSCAQCQARLAELQAARHAFATRPEAQRVLGAVLSRAVRAPPRRRLAPAIALGLALAAGLVLLVQAPWRSPDDATRLKGSPAVLLLDPAGSPVTTARPGETLTLAIGSGGYSHALITARGDDGAEVRLWPAAGDAYGPLPAGARVPLRTLEVTPGDVTVRAAFADEPRPATAPPDREVTLRLEVAP